MTRASKILHRLEEKEQEFEFWVSKDDTKDALKAMNQVGFTSDDLQPSKRKIKGMTVWTISSTKFALQNLQHELSNKDINSWLEGENA